MSKQLLHELAQVFDSHQLFSSELYREIYSRDGSYFNIKPEVIVRPETLRQVQQLLAIASESGTGITFRTGGTSLSGQSVSKGIICELRTAWKKSEVRDQGRKIWFEPGLTAHQINTILKKYQAKIGPDPASAIAAMMGVFSLTIVAGCRPGHVIIPIIR